MFEWFKKDFNMNKRQVTALMGVHSLGGAQEKNSGYKGVWTPGRENVFDNEFHKLLDIEATLYRNQANRIDSTGDKKFQWNWIAPFGKFMMLNTDMALAYDIDVNNTGDGTQCQIFKDFDRQGSCSTADTWSFVKLYSNNESMFLKDFVEAYEIMMNGKNGSLVELD